MHFVYGATILGTAAAGVFKLISSGTEDVGQAINETGSGALKIALAVGGTYLVLKKAKVI